MASDPLDDARKLLRDATRPLGTWDAFLQGAATNPARRSAIMGLIEAARLRFVALAKELASRFRKKIPGLGPWPRDFLAMVAAGHNAAAMAVVGSVDPAPADLEAVAEAVSAQQGFFARFRKKVAKGKQLIFAPVAAGVATAKRVLSGSFLGRSRMYADPLYSTGEEVFRRKMARDGFDEELWVLGPAEKHCAGCPAQASRGYVRMGTLPAIGSQPCSFGCRCWKSYRHTISGLVVPSPFALA